MKSKSLVRIIGTIFLLIFFYGSSICLTFYNKWMTKRYRFPLTISTVHFVVVFLMSALCRKLLEIRTKEERIVLEWGQYIKKVFPTAIAASFDIGLSNWSVMLSAVSLYTMAKSSTILFILFFSVLLGLEKLTFKLMAITLLIGFGLFLFTYKSKDFNMLGFSMAILASIMAGIRWTTTQLVMQKKSLGLGNPVDAIFHIQPIMAITSLIFAVSMEGSAIASSGLLFRAPSVHVVFTSVVIGMFGALLAFLLTLSEFLFISNTSSLALSIAGIFKEICTLTIAFEIGENQWTAVNFVGLVICLAGISVHVVTKAVKDSDTYNHINDKDSVALSSLLHEGFSDSDEDVFFDSTNRARLKRLKPGE